MKKPTHRLRDQEAAPTPTVDPVHPGLVTPDMLQSGSSYRGLHEPQKVDPKSDPLRALDLGAVPNVRVPLGPERRRQPTLRDVLPKPAGPAHSPQDELLQFVKSLGERSGLEAPELARLLRKVSDQLAPATAPARAAPPLPEQPPETWAARDLNRRETPPQFITRAYAQWLGRGLSRKDLKNLDPDLYRALSVWLTRHPEDDIAKALPRKSDKLDDLIDKLAAEHSLEDLRKLGYAIDARLKRESKRQNST